MTDFTYAQAKVVDIHDGDTIFVDILLDHTGKITHDVDLGFGIHRTPHGHELPRQSVRLLGCNAPELSTPAGKAALAFIESVCPIGTIVTLVSHNWDKYGDRVDGSVTLPDGRDLTTVMIESGNAAVWDGTGTKPVPGGSN